MKKRGFTLAEILLTLGIIGLITALTLPMFNYNMQNTSNGARLASTVSTLENALTTMVVKEDTDTLFETEAWENGDDRNIFASTLGNYLVFENSKEISTSQEVKTFYKKNGPYVLKSNGDRSSSINDDLSKRLVQVPNSAMGNQVLGLKNGATAFLIVNKPQDADDETITAIRSLGGNLYNKAGEIWIDVNGSAPPNTLGRDIFGFYIGENAKLYPLGGKDAAVYDISGSGTPQTWDNANSDRICLNGSIKDSGYGCTGRVVAEGYKINY